MDNPEKMAA